MLFQLGGLNAIVSSWLYLTAAIAASPSAIGLSSASPSNVASLEPLGRRQFDEVLTLRIMVLGASIMYGSGSTNQNGCRQALRTQLRQHGYEVNMVGSRQAGSMIDNDVEGWPGYRINQIAEKANPSVAARQPNLILLQAGSNDIFTNTSTSTAHLRMGNLIDALLARAPTAVILVGGLYPQADVRWSATFDSVNSNICALVARRKAAGQAVDFVDFRNGFVQGDLGDGTHPTDEGYVKQASRFVEAVLAHRTWIVEPVDTGVSDFVDESGGGKVKASVLMSGFATLVALILL